MSEDIVLKCCCGYPMIFGKATEDWDGTNEVKLDPCTAAGEDIPGKENVTAYIVSPTGNTPSDAGTEVKIAKDDILGYLPFGDNEGLLVNPQWRTVCWGKATADWEWGVSEITLTPCASDTDGTPNGLPNVTANIVSPVGDEPGLVPDISQNDILAYMPYRDGSEWRAVMLNVNWKPVGGLWGEADADWVNAAGNGSYVDVNPCNRDGSGVDTGTTHRVYLPRNGRDEDPNVHQDDVISYVRAKGGGYVNPSGCLDGKINCSVRPWLSAGAIPQGWSVLDDAEGRFLVGISDEDGYEDQATVGDTGGNKQHGDGTNDHTMHPDHVHEVPDIDACWRYVEESGLGQGPFGQWTGQQVTADTHEDFDFEHTETDNRPPYYAVVWIKRTS